MVAWTFGKAEGYFDVIEWDGDGSGSVTKEHALNKKPGMVIVKNCGKNQNWDVYHSSLGYGVNKGLVLNKNDAAAGYFSPITASNETTITLDYFNNLNESTFAISSQKIILV